MVLRNQMLTGVPTTIQRKKNEMTHVEKKNLEFNRFLVLELSSSAFSRSESELVSIELELNVVDVKDCFKFLRRRRVI